jgi:hypothetical protein
VAQVVNNGPPVTLALLSAGSSPVQLQTGSNEVDDNWMQTWLSQGNQLNAQVINGTIQITLGE